MEDRVPPFKPHLSHEPVRAFVEALLDRGGFASVPAADRAEAVTALAAEAGRRVGLALWKKLDPDSVAYFRTLVRRGAQEDELAAFFDVRVPDAESVMHAALHAFGKECLESARGLRPTA